MFSEKIKVLVVDDDLFFRKMLPKKLSSESFLFDVAENGAVALEKFFADPNFGLIISDMEMPVMNGLELIKKIRESKHDAPLIIMTASDQVSVAIEAMKIGANDYLLKDENILRTLPISVERVLEKHQLKLKNKQLLQDLAVKNMELEQSNRELRESNELKNKFLGIAAHDLRNPLSSLRGLSELFLNETFGELNEEQKKFMKLMDTATSEMLVLVDDLLDVSVIESGKLELNPEKASINEMVKSRIKLNRLQAEKKEMSVILELADISDVKFDFHRIAQVFDNLVSNAVKYSPPGSKIRVFTSQEEKMVKVSIQDEGPGISVEEKSRLFGEFQRLSAQPTAGEKSTGLGLAIVKKIIDAHGGLLEVNSEVGRGSIFSFLLPKS
jgi:signal transduction histidine kinase